MSWPNDGKVPLNKITLLLKKRWYVLRVKRSEILPTKRIRKEMWLFTSDAEIDRHQIVPIKYNMNWVQAGVGRRAGVCCVSVVTTANLAEDGLLHLKIFREQETCDPVIHRGCWFLVMSKPAFCIQQTSTEIPEVWAEKVTETASVIV